MPRNGIDEEINFLIKLSLSNDGIILGFGMGVLALKTWWSYFRHSKALHLLQNSHSPNISSLKSFIKYENEHDSTNSNQNKINGVSNSDKLSAASPSFSIPKPLFVVRGVVRSKLKKGGSWPPLEIREVIKSEHSDDSGVILEKSESCVCIDMRSIFGWLNYRTPVSMTTKIIPFSLYDVHDMNECNSLSVNLDASRHPLPLTRTFVKISPSPQSFSSLLFHILLGNRYPIGILEEEKMLKINSEMTAIGHIEISKEGNFTISSSNSMPYFLTEMNKEQLMEEFKIKSKFFFWGGFAITIFSLAIIGNAIFQKWRRWKLSSRAFPSQRMRLFNDDVDGNEGEENEEEDPNSISDGELCIVCFSRRRKVVFIGCGHRVCCCTCARQIFYNNGHASLESNANSPSNTSGAESNENRVPRCPICREVVSCVYRVYDV